MNSLREKMRKVLVGFLMLIHSSIFTVHVEPRGSQQQFRCPDAVFAFGDSLTDTGNDAIAFPGVKPTLNYGRTYFHRFAGRASDGRLLIDFLAQAFGVPFLIPILQNNSDYRHGANFASRGATARSTAIVTPFFLDVQVREMIKFRDTVQPNSGSLSTALYVIYIGINDFWQNLHNNHMPIQKLESVILPQVIQAVSKAMQDLYIQVGARNFMLVSVPALGCLPVVLSEFGSRNPKDYDPDGCLHSYNNLVEAYNSKLRDYASKFRLKFPKAQVFYADFFKLHKEVIANPSRYGFAQATKLIACCGGGGVYQQPVKQCGLSSTPACDDPSGFISWDGIHFTDAFSRVAAGLLFGSYGQTNIYLEPYLNISCLHAHKI